MLPADPVAAGRTVGAVGYRLSGGRPAMPDSDPSAHALDVPGAQLYYERRGTGPLLLMIGSPMDSTGFAGLASALAGDYTMVTYDPRGSGNSSREDAAQDVTPGQ